MIRAKETWKQHFLFAFLVGSFLIVSGVFFLVHAILPFIPVPTKFGLKSISTRLGQANFNREQFNRIKIR